jgi:hypothetical protein
MDPNSKYMQHQIPCDDLSFLGCRCASTLLLSPRKSSPARYHEVVIEEDNVSDLDNLQLLIQELSNKTAQPACSLKRLMCTGWWIMADESSPLPNMKRTPSSSGWRSTY